MKRLGFGLLLASLAFFTSALADDEDDAKLITVRVLDGAGAPITNAWVRLPQTEGRRMVDEVGRWQAKSLYELDGRERFFMKGMVLDLTISAPGYTSRAVGYEVRNRRNLVTVQLEPMNLTILDEENDEDLMIRWFQRTYVDDSE
jgi:hypothetical protein